MPLSIEEANNMVAAHGTDEEGMFATNPHATLASLDIPPPRLLPDDPEIDDRFGGHSQIADALARLILSRHPSPPSDRYGTAIALVGPFGSGKSTTVRLLETKLAESDSKVTVVTFDAWNHQGDPLRRAFIEELLIQTESPAKPNVRIWQRWRRENREAKREAKEEKEWRAEIQKALEGRTSWSESQGGITIWGALGALALLAMPVALAFMSNYGQSTVFTVRRPRILSFLEIARDTTGGWDWLIGTSALALIAFVLLTYLIVGMIGWAKRRRVKKNAGDTELNFLHIGILSRRTRQVTRSHTSPDPSSLEFRHYFERILKEVTKDRDLVLVIDNLDRLAPETAANAWSAMRTFLDPKVKTGALETDEARIMRNSSMQLHRFWVVVPFSPSGIRAEWKSTAKTGQSRAAIYRRERIRKSRGTATPSQTSDFFQALIDKTFQVTVQVPTPVPSSSYDYVIEQLGDAFGPLLTVENKHDVARVFEFIEPGPHLPRRVKRFVNDLVVSALEERDDDIALPIQAAYLLLGKMRLDPERERQLISILGISREAWRTVAAALKHKVPLDDARQVRTRDLVQKALGNGHWQNAEEVFDIPGAHHVMLNEIQRIAWVNAPASLDLAAKALADISQQNVEKQDHAWANAQKRAWNQLREASRKVVVWDLPEGRGDGLGEILGRMMQDSPNDATTLLITLTSLPAPELPVPDSNDDGKR